MSFNTFRDLSIPSALSKSLAKMSFEKPTPVQKAAIPPALTGRDVLGTAQTGTGKTAAFGIPMLGRIYAQPGKVALVLAPTRELAAQINTVLKRMAKGIRLHGTLVVGGESFGRQVKELERGVDYIVATPGRLNDHLQERTIKLSSVSFLVLDEVDRMLDMGFSPQIKQIVRHIPRKRQTLLFSATLPKSAAQMANQFLKEPVRVAIESPQDTAPIDEKMIHTSPREKSQRIVSEVQAGTGKTLIFTRTQSRTERVARVLGKSGHKVVNLHGGRTQGQRKRALDMFRSGTHPIMVATDIAGRGIDVTDIETVVNYDIPRCREDYIHRIGRTARNGRPGQALNFVTPEDEDIERILLGKTASKSRSNSGPRKKKAARRFGGKRKRRPQKNRRPSSQRRH